MKRFFPILILFLLLTISCDKGDSSPIPYVPINRTLTLANPQYNALFGIGGFVQLPEEGYGGLIVVRATGDQVFAFDRQCTKDVFDENAQTKPDDSFLFMHCDVCGSEWQILNGQLTKGPATFPLLQYQTTFDGYVVKIFN